MTVGGSRSEVSRRGLATGWQGAGLAALLVLAVSIAGCGGGGGGTEDERAVEAALKRTQQAFADGDLKSVCASLTAAGRAQIGQLGHDILGDVPPQPCEPDLKLIAAGIEKGSGSEAATARRVTDIEIDGDSATATVDFGGGASGAVPLADELGRWKVDALYGGLPAAQREDAF
jgi:hypothetical protein